MPSQNEIDEKKWPKLLRQAVNWCIRRLNRPCEIKFQNTTAGQWLQTDAKETIILPEIPAGEWKEFTDCDGATFEVFIRNYTPAP